MHTLLTPRLRLRPALLADVPEIARVAGTSDPDRILRGVNASLPWWEAYGYGFRVLSRLADPAIIGWCALRPGDAPMEPELFYGLAAPEQRQGLATEAVSAVLHAVFRAPAVRSVWAATRFDHAASVRVMENSGMQFERRIMLEGVDSVIYRARPRPATFAPGEGP